MDFYYDSFDPEDVSEGGFDLGGLDTDGVSALRPRDIVNFIDADNTNINHLFHFDLKDRKTKKKYQENFKEQFAEKLFEALKPFYKKGFRDLNSELARITCSEVMIEINQLIKKQTYFQKNKSKEFGILLFSRILDDIDHDWSFLN